MLRTIPPPLCTAATSDAMPGADSAAGPPSVNYDSPINDRMTIFARADAPYTATVGLTATFQL